MSTNNFLKRLVADRTFPTKLDLYAHLNNVAMEDLFWPAMETVDDENNFIDVAWSLPWSTFIVESNQYFEANTVILFKPNSAVNPPVVEIEEMKFKD